MIVFGSQAIALVREIESAAAKITVQGDRYPAHLQARVGR